ncbi:MAG: alpha-amylase [Bacteroidales bacterium]|nr:alpha-amylase [Bacteroidales bacterium]MBP5214661.1 alpha-amylase [Bacteroidales bacterium]
MKIRHLVISALLGLGGLYTISCSSSGNWKEAHDQKTNNDIILHAWCWSFNTIRENLPDIAEAGYTIVQTPPAQLCITETADDPGGGYQIFGHGRWYYHYQPIDWKIGNYQVGTEDELTELCAEARKYGIRIIVDVLPNHTAIDDTQVRPELDAAVGGHANLYHANGRTEITDYNDRLQCTTGQMGGLPDVNTENPAFQSYFLQYINNLIKCGVRGFRYDTAKHIGLPSDPKDSKSERNNFWDVVMGRESVLGNSLCMDRDSLFIYGEVLQDRNVKETEYAEYMGLTASGMGWDLRHDLEAGNWLSQDVSLYCHPADPYKLVTWVESHDTYCNDHESAHLTDQQIRLGWVYLTCRAYGVPLFYSRPAGSDGPSGNYWGNNVVGARGNDNFKHPLVVEANMFRHWMRGLSETVFFSDNGSIAEVCRGKTGVALINIAQKAEKVKIPTTLPDDDYTDIMSDRTFTVEDGILTGSMEPLSACILVRH